MKRLRFLHWRSLFHRSRFESNMADEFAFHLQARTGDLIRSGMVPAEAERRARIEFGAGERYRAECRESHRVHWLDEGERSIRYALRNLRQSSLSSSIAILSLALGLAAVGVMFAVVDTVLLRPLPFPDSSRIAVISQKVPFLSSSPTVVTADEFQAWQKSGLFHSLALVDAAEFTLDTRGHPERIYGATVTPDFFRVFQIQPILGRGFTNSDAAREPANVLLLSHQLWASRFGSDRNIIGAAVHLNGRVLTVIGVMPAGFNFPRRTDVSSIMNWAPNQAEFWIPFVITPQIVEQGNFNYYAIGRLRDNVTFPQAAAQLLSPARYLFKDKAVKYPQYKALIEQMLGLLTIYVTPLRETMSWGFDRQLWMLLAAVAVLLALVLFNLGSLLLTRNAQRAREYAVRQALGASRWQLLRQSVFEQMVLIGVAWLVASALEWWGISLVRAIAANRVPRLYELQFHWTGIALLLAIAFLTSLIFGSLSQLLLSKTPFTSGLVSQSRSTTADRNSHRLRSVLVTAEIAGSVILLVVAGLLGESFANVTHQQPGFNPHHVLSVEVPFTYTATDPAERRAQHIRILIERLRQLPGVQSASIINRLPLAGDNEIHDVRALGKPLPRLAEDISAEYRVIDAGLFRTLQIRLLKGREFRPDDPVSFAIVNKRMAHRLWPGEDPIGQHFTDDNSILQVIGVVDDVHYGSLEKPPMMQFYRLITADPYYADIFVLRSTQDPDSLVPLVQKTVWRLNSSEPVTHLQTMDRLLQSVTLQRRFTTELLGSFAAIASFLAALGLFSVASLSVARRTREFGIRLAIGATANQILRLEMLRTATLVSVGLALGLSLSMLVTRTLAGLLYGVKPWNGTVFALAASVLIASALLATWLPAQRAARTDPATALRTE